MVEFFDIDPTIRGNRMMQLHRRFTNDEVKVLLNGYSQRLLGRGEIQEILDIGMVSSMITRE
jgi:hypothetical protein